MWPIMAPFGRRTAVPSTRSLAINGWDLVMTSLIITIHAVNRLAKSTPQQEPGSSELPAKTERSPLSF
jgi:hypothetical protein